MYLLAFWKPLTGDVK